MNEIIKVELDKQPIELCKLLKVANLVGGGGEAKIVISEGYVLVNGETEYQKRKKIYHQDIIEFNGELVKVYCLAPIETKTKVKNDVKSSNPILSVPTAKKANTTDKKSKPGGRKRISF